MSEMTETAPEAMGVLRDGELAEALAAARGAHELVEELYAALREERSRTQEIPQLLQEVARLEAELHALRATKVFRYTVGLRAIRASRLSSG